MFERNEEVRTHLLPVGCVRRSGSWVISYWSQRLWIKLYKLSYTSESRHPVLSHPGILGERSSSVPLSRSKSCPWLSVTYNRPVGDYRTVFKDPGSSFWVSWPLSTTWVFLGCLSSLTETPLSPGLSGVYEIIHWLSYCDSLGTPESVLVPFSLTLSFLWFGCLI